MALNRHFSGHFARFVHRFSAISHRGLSLGENDPGLLAETMAGARRRERARDLYEQIFVKRIVIATQATNISMRLCLPAGMIARCCDLVTNCDLTVA
jgi:hypothetical protein